MHRKLKGDDNIIVTFLVCFIQENDGRQKNITSYPTDLSQRLQNGIDDRQRFFPLMGVQSLFLTLGILLDCIASSSMICRVLLKHCPLCPEGVLLYFSRNISA